MDYYRKLSREYRVLSDAIGIIGLDHTLCTYRGYRGYRGYRIIGHLSDGTCCDVVELRYTREL